MAEQNMPHSLTLQNRKKLTLSGVLEVLRFDDTAVQMNTPLGMLVVQGSGLQLKNLTPDGGNVALEGEISWLGYEENRAGGWLRRFFS